MTQLGRLGLGAFFVIMFGKGRACSMRGGGCVLPVMYILLSLLVTRGTASVVLVGKNVSLALDDMEANFAPTIRGSGESGAVYLTEPLDACSLLTNIAVEGTSSFALIIRGGCTFDVKVRNAQKAGFKAAIVYDIEDSGVLVAMAGNPVGVKIHAVFISKASGEILKKYAGRTDIELWIIPTFENEAWSIMAISFISLLAMSAVLATCFFVRRHHIWCERPRAPHVRECHGMNSRLVKAMPSLIFTSALEDSCTSRTCAICLEDYIVGEKLRILPCHHKFHEFCVDAWLTTWRTFCPVCKRDANTSTGDPPASECTPLLSSVPASPSSSSGLPSFHSSGPPSPAIQVFSSPVQSLSAPQNHSLACIPCTPHSQRSCYNSPAVSVSRSSADLRHLLSYRSSASHLRSSHSLGVPLSPPINSRYASPSHIISSHSGEPLSSPINSRYASPYIYDSSTGSPSYLVGSSGRGQSFLHDCSSATSLSALASAQSLPEFPEC